MIKAINTSSVKNRRKFDETIKREAARTGSRAGSPLRWLRGELGLTASLHWVRAIRRFYRRCL
jgi:hypothetical protein